MFLFTLVGESRGRKYLSCNDYMTHSPMYYSPLSHKKEHERRKGTFGKSRKQNLPSLQNTLPKAGPTVQFMGRYERAGRRREKALLGRWPVSTKTHFSLVFNKSL